MTELIKDIRQILVFMKKTGVRFRFFSLSILFSLGLTFFNLYTVSLLFPLVKGIIESNFDHVKTLKVVGSIVRLYPDVFSNSIRLFILLVVWIYFSIILKNGLQYVASVSTDYQAKQATITLRNLLLERYMIFGKSFFDNNKTPVIHRILTRSSRAIEKQFSLFKNLIINCCLFIMFLFTMIKISWLLTIVSMTVFPIVNHFTRRSMRRIKEFLSESEEAEEDLSNKVFNILNCLPLIKGFVKEEDEKAIFHVTSSNEINKSYKAKKISSLLPPIEDMGSTTTMLLLAFGMAFVIHMTGALDPSGAFVFFYLAQKLVPTLNSFNDFAYGMMKSRSEVEEVNNILEQNDDYIVKEGDKEFTGLVEGIEIKNLTFAYAGTKKPAIYNLNMTIPKGKMTAIVGPTGSGKSTIANLLLRFYDVEPGGIFIDGIDIKEFKSDFIRKKISFVGQDHLLFNDTIMKNISYGKSDNIDDEYIQTVSQKSVVHDFVDMMPDKYETIIGEKGSNLSGGEKQRISIARALIKEHEILILDEATSALDAGTEDRIMKTLQELSSNKTRIIISHRLSTIKDADNIVFIENGEVKESGTLEEILALEGDFYKHWQLQKLS